MIANLGGPKTRYPQARSAAVFSGSALAMATRWELRFMSIRFACPHCRATIKAAGASAGKQLACPKCDLPLEVPIPKGDLLPDNGAVVAITSVPANDPFAFDSPGNEDSEDYFAPPRRRNRGNGTVALVWGVLGFFLFPPLGFVAISLAKRALREDYTDGAAKAALIFGWIDVVFCFLFCLSASIALLQLAALWQYTPPGP
jgi:hypothetical protein